MFRKLSIIALIPLLAVIFVGCSNSSNRPTGPTPGDPDDPTFQKTQELSDDFAKQYLGNMNSGLYYINFSGPMLKPADTSFVTFDEESYWWVLVVDELTDPVSVPFCVVDSVRFNAGTEYQQFPDETTTAIDYRLWAEFHYEIGDTALDVYAHDDCLLEGFTEDTVEVNGATSYSIEGNIGDVEVEYSLSGDAEDVKFLRAYINGDGSHPVDGTVNITVSIQTSGQIGNLPATNATWTLTLNFDEDGYDARLVSGNNYWEWSRSWNELARVGGVFNRYLALTH